MFGRVVSFSAFRFCIFTTWSGTKEAVIADMASLEINNLSSNTPAFDQQLRQQSWHPRDPSDTSPPTFQLYFNDTQTIAENSAGLGHGFSVNRKDRYLLKWQAGFNLSEIFVINDIVVELDLAEVEG
jgi:hypothetical protein